MKKIVMICTAGDSSNYIYNNVSKDFEISQVFIVNSENKKKFLKRRIKNLGLLKVIGQILFIAYQKKILTPQSTNRINEIKEIYNLNDTNIPKYKVKYTSSVNSLQIKQALQELKPDLVIVNGTPIIKESILTATQAHFLNIHVGITPKYRGVHGGYWAYYNNDGDLAGVTIHLIDTGIDTGEVLEQKLILKDKKDNFITYPVLQIGEALKNYNNIIRSLLNNEFKIKSPMTNESNLWYHPTLLEYLFGRIKRNIK